jgi:hypothetical protein
MNEDENLLDPEQAAKYLGVKPETLAVWRCTKRYDLPYIKVGRCIRYRPADVKAFNDRNYFNGK